MARPTRTRPSVRVQVAPPPAPPSLDVAAPMAVRTPNLPSGLQALTQALGIGATIYGANRRAQEQQDFQEGQADEQLGEADALRAQKSRRYADGAFQVAILEQYQEAERKVAERAASDDLDKSLPADDQVRIVDGWMKSALGPLVADPRAKLLIGERYQQFVDKFAGNVLASQAEANAKAAEDAATQDILSQVDRTGSFNYDEQFHRLYSQNGDPVRSNKLLVGVVAQMMEDAAMRGEDPSKYRALIPTEVRGPNGEKLPGPMYNPEYRGIINTAMARGEQLRDHFYRQQYAAQEYQARVKLDEDLAKGVPITPDSIAAYGFKVGNDPSDTLSPALAAAYIQQSQRVKVEKAQEQAEMDGALAARATYGRWGAITGLPGAPDSQEKTQKLYDNWVQLNLTALGAPPESLGGAGLTSNPELVSAVANLSAQEGLPYGPLKRDLSAISQAAPGDIMQRVNAYKVLKAKGVAGDYVDDDAALAYEVALGAEEAGEKPEGIAERIRTMGDKTTAQYVASQMPAIQKAARRSGFQLRNGSGIFGTGKVTSTQTLNAPYLAAKYERLAMSALSKGLALSDAQAYAQERIQQSHVALNVDGKWVALPRAAVPDPEAATQALDWYSQTQLPALAKKLKLPEDEELTIMPRYDINGRGLSFEVDRMGGVQTGVVFNLPGLIDTWMRNVPKRDYRQEAIDRQRFLHRVYPDTTPPGVDLNPAHQAGHE